MAFESDKTMFEIYRETTYTGKYRVVYFTELQDHDKETEINRAMAGEASRWVCEKPEEGRSQGGHLRAAGTPERRRKADGRRIAAALGEHLSN